jgi:hypothetical protein
LIPFHKNFICDDPESKAQLGDVVRIEAIKAISPSKYFAVNSVIQLGKRYTDPTTGETHAYIPPGFIKDYSKFPEARLSKKR